MIFQAARYLQSSRSWIEQLRLSASTGVLLKRGEQLLLQHCVEAVHTAYLLSELIQLLVYKSTFFVKKACVHHRSTVLHPDQ